MTASGDDASNTTADQDAWVALTEAMREQLSRIVPTMPAMQPGELEKFVEASNGVMWMHFRAVAWDRRVELELARTAAED